MTNVAAEPAPASARAPACAGGRRSATASACTPCTRSVRNRFGSAGGDPGPAFGHAKDDRPRRAVAAPLLRAPPPAAGTSTSRDGASSAVERVLRHRPLPRDLRGPRVAVPAGPGALPAVAQHPRPHHLPRGHRLRRLLAHAAAAPRRPRSVRRLPDLCTRPRRAGRRRGRLPAAGATATASSTRSSATAGGSPSATRATRSSPTSTRRCRACTSGGRRGARSCCMPMLRRRWAKVLAALYPRASPSLHRA